MTAGGAGSTRRAVLCALLVGGVCAGAAAPRRHRSGDGTAGVLVAAALPTRQLTPGSTRPSDVVALWQSVLWADGYRPFSSVTCAYDQATVDATRVWQSNHHLSPDGIVGAATWGTAAQRIVPAGRWMVYLGERHGLPLRLDAEGAYEVYDAGRFRPLRTDAATLTRCR
ncbi:peptidoglycan-binding domain-containing protein [Actinacidiphila acidipaludis]|uniref:Peptidoglycan-binding protein n=1 Tax=Actinacidiphila acidipaludis TaxID=2873382 RepID=A0ABS7QHA8_9ACTN|nr:peptidoglycan-binding protein [Streptomyces acidipaludis]MBY8882564.1 peptidoglycan-binding protein [Streptomyces acidipaludis]